MNRAILLVMAASMIPVVLASAGAAEALAKPTPEQAAWQEMELGMFLHFGLYSFPGGKEQIQIVGKNGGPEEGLWHWPGSKDILNNINPSQLDTDQWVRVAESMGAKYLVFTAKHSLGWCMWQTETTEFSVKNLGWRDGKGDIIADLAASCKKRGIRFGIYLSPSDVQFGAPNGLGGYCPDPQDQERYNKVYRQQLTELLSRYGELCEVWFDGSLVVEVGDILKKYAPKAMIFQSPHTTIRWVGNEAGQAPDPAWNAVKKADAEGGVATARHGDPNGEVWLPMECDARIRKNWMYEENSQHTLKSVDQLMDMYYNSVGHGTVLLLNHTPDTTGLIPEADVKRAAEFGAEIQRRFGTSLAETACEGGVAELTFEKPTVIDHAISMERIREGERIREYVIEGWAGGAWVQMVRGQSVGHKKIDPFDAIQVSKVRLRVLRSAAKPLVRKFAVYRVYGDEPFDPALSTKEPVGYWRLDAVVDNKVQNAAAAEAPGVVVGTTTVEGIQGRALRFHGRGDCVAVSTRDYFRGDFTLSVWVKPAGVASDHQTLVSKERGDSASHQCRLYLDADNRLGFMMSDGENGDLWPFTMPTGSLPADKWSHVVVTREGRRFLLYVNGGVMADKSTGKVLRHSNREELRFGASTPKSGIYPAHVFDGTIDEVRIYNRALPGAEISALRVEE